ncbi:cysteine and histidine-rich domain-containing protein 1-like [Liolophura sinensis]|uniref:cysteine and histidine-rich domain-containing protein 1-like n=1 Tax=Liolophura sinensis TaxID=3198878 RepID=UPI00315981C2
MALLQCYNKGCGQKYDPNETKTDSCKFHPGGPIFHDALKGWSCCKKRSTDFSEFLSIPGCLKGKHNNVKPPAEPSKQESKDEKEVVVSVPKKEVRPPNNATERPSVNEPMIELKKTVGATLKQALEKQMNDLSLQGESNEKPSTGEITIGTTCKNNACGKTYQGESSNSEDCVYHPGTPVFHEGLKFWSCCQKRTTEFDTFLQQVGCKIGQHVWIKAENPGQKKTCRYDWHQTGSTVNISVYSKLAIPDRCRIEANRVSCSVYIVFEGGKSLFEQKFILCGVIDPTKSNVKMAGTKVEINLIKAELFHWPDLVSAIVSDQSESGNSLAGSSPNNVQNLQSAGF